MWYFCLLPLLCMGQSTQVSQKIMSVWWRGQAWWRFQKSATTETKRKIEWWHWWQELRLWGPVFSFEFGVEIKHENGCPRLGRILHEMKRLLVSVGGGGVTSSLKTKPPHSDLKSCVFVFFPPPCFLLSLNDKISLIITRVGMMSSCPLAHTHTHTHTHAHTHTIIRAHTHTALGQTAAKEFFWVELFMQLSRPVGVSSVCVCVCVRVRARVCVCEGERERVTECCSVYSPSCVCVSIRCSSLPVWTLEVTIRTWLCSCVVLWCDY